MRILIVNDDGIRSEGICRLAAMAKTLVGASGEVWVAAPKNQCSAMSHRITVFDPIEVRKADFPVEGVNAYSIDGTPADCVKIALNYLMPQKPDFVFSGINYGYNVGVDILYSGTVGAAMEGLINGIPSIAFSNQMGTNFDVIDAYLPSIAKELMEKAPGEGRIWNVNFPGCLLSELKGINRDSKVALKQFYQDHYEKQEAEDGSCILQPRGIVADEAEEGTDIQAVLDGYITIGTVRNALL